MVGHDSGPLHLASAFGVPVVGVYAPGQPERTFPQGAGVWRMLHRASPADIKAPMIVREIDELGVFSPR
jgi:ADP-heptose:LPS heptosyltransferase